MMVLRARATADNGNLIIPDTNDAGAEFLLPADRCTWRQGYDGTSYTVTTAAYTGAGATVIPLVDPQLGFVGKSGRFVEIAS